MKQEIVKRRRLFMLVVLVIVVIFMYWLNLKSNHSTNLPDEFVVHESTEVLESTDTTSKSNETSSTSESEEFYESTYDGEQDIAARFASTYLTFKKDSLKSVEEIIEPSLSSKLEQLKGEEQEIDSLSLLDKSKLEDKNVYVYEFKSTLTGNKKSKNGKIFIIMKKQSNDEKSSVVNDVEWTYEA